MATVGVLRETGERERRVALPPDGVRRLRERDVTVLVEAGAGERAWFGDDAYGEAGALVCVREKVFADSDVLLCLAPPGDVRLCREGQVLIGLLGPLSAPAQARTWANAGVTAVSLDLLPRTLSRAQAMDALSSQANVAGYKAALLAAEAYGGYFPMLMTAAGTTRPAQVLVLGAGVAGLQAIATARRLGALVTGYDVREAARADIASTGAAVLDLTRAAGTQAAGTLESGPPKTGPQETGPREADPRSADAEGADPGGNGTPAQAGAGSGYARALTADEAAAQQAALAAAVPRFDVVITTAQVPGRRPPLLVPASAVAAMRPGSVIVDLAAGEHGGNVDGCLPDTRTVTAGGVTVIGAGRLAATVPVAASTAYGRNISAMLHHLMPGGTLAPDLGDEITGAVVVTHGGAVVHPQVVAAARETAARERAVHERAAHEREARA